MRFITYINNQKAVQWGLNANQAALFDLLNQASSWAKEIVIDGAVYYWVSRNVVIEELPLFYSKPDTVYRHFVEFHKKELIEYRKVGEKDLIRLTEKGKSWNEFNQPEIRNSSDSNPTLGNKSESTRIEIRNSSDSNPTDHNTNYKNTNDHIKKTTQKNSTLALLEAFGITEQLAEDFIRLRKAKKAPITQTAMTRLQNQADLAKAPLREVVEVMIERGWAGFNANWDWRPQSNRRETFTEKNARDWSSPEKMAEVF